VLVRPAADQAKADPVEVLCAFRKSVAASGVFEACQHRFPAAPGTLIFQTRVPGPDSAAEHHLSIDAAGDLAGTPLGRCLIDAARTAAAGHDAPEARNGLVSESELRASSLLETWNGKCRR
jgi:hypothetical protein